MKMKSQIKNDDNGNEGKKDKNKFRGKTIGVTTNGEIIYIQDVNINNLKSDFLEINTKMRNYNRKNSKNQKNMPNNLTGLANKPKIRRNSIEIEKNFVDESYFDFYRINNKDKMSQQIITGGSSFKNFVPEIGVRLKQNGNIKSGGTDFLHKYKKISLEEFEKTLEMFKKSNLPNNEFIEIKNANTPNNINNKNNNNSYVYNNSAHNNNFKNQKSLIKSSSLPELNQMNSRTNLEASNIFNSINNNIIMNNDSNIKNSFNFTNYNNSNFMSSTKYNNMNNFIKTSSSFKNLFREENPYLEEKNVIPNYTTKQFFKNFNHKTKNISSFKKKERTSLSKIEDFNFDILNSHNWGSVTNAQGRSNKKIKPFFKTTKKFFDKNMNNIFRVRSNVNETYFRKMRVFNKISLRSQSTENKGKIHKIIFNKKE